MARSFKAEKTPHAFVLWREQGKWIIKYRGAIDDNGNHPELVQRHYLIDALNDLLNGKNVRIAEGEAVGCAIHYR
ncbi:MAG: hypothetical protein U0T73_05125 [Chitinophagales bacterium]